MKQFQRLLLSLFSVLMLFNACKKDLAPKPKPDIEQTPSEKLLVQNLASVGYILQELYKTPQHVKLVNIAIQSKVYTDESIILRDLLYPAESRLNESKYFGTLSQQQGVKLEIFAEAFWKEANKNRSATFATFLNQLKRPRANTALRTGESTNGDEVTIYFPYSELFLPPDGDNGGGTYTYGTITSIVTATEDADEGYGQQPIYLNGLLTGYRTVLVNDDYAEQYPTHIIGLNGVEEEAPPSRMSAFEPTDPVDLPNLSREILEVYVGAVRINDKHQFDNLIAKNKNGGGSEIRFTRADGYLKLLNGQVQAENFQAGATKEVGRWHIRKGKWVDYSVSWDSDWEPANLTQNIAIYEEDTEGTEEISGSFGTTLTIPGGGTTVSNIGYKNTLKTQDEVQHQNDLSRDAFKIRNRMNIEGEMYKNWPVRDRNALVSFTLNDRTFY
jgi:hypothetical protein